MRVLVVVVVGALALFVLSCDEDSSVGPVVHNVLPSLAVPGSTIDILGDRFCSDGSDECAADASTQVSLGLIQIPRGNFITYEQARISVGVPADLAPGSTLLVVSRDGQSSEPVVFEVEAR